ncbi:hypothetical protein D3C74_488960 [compost metagenome]
MAPTKHQIPHQTQIRLSICVFPKYLLQTSDYSSKVDQFAFVTQFPAHSFAPQVQSASCALQRIRPLSP